MALSNDTKIKVGTDESWFWVAPMPVSASVTGLDVTFSTPTYTETLELDRYYTTLVVEGLASDQKTLTLALEPVVSQGLSGPAFLITRQGDIFPVRVEKVVGDQVTLEDPLNSLMTFSEEEQGELQFATWYTTLDGTLTNEVRRDVNWQVVYSFGDFGNNEQPRQTVDSGVVQIVQKPFATSLSHDSLLGYFPFLIGLMPDRQASLRPQIDAAERELIVRLRGELKPLGKSEDDVDGFYFQPAHAYLTASLMLYGDLNTFDQAAQLREIYNTNFTETLKRILLDTDDDGTSDTTDSLTGGFNGATTSSFLQACFHRPFKFRVDGRR
jgi:hypothetical protein